MTARAALARWWYPLTLGGLVAGVFGWNAYRAATLAITHDEAVTYEWFVAGGPAGILWPHEFDANNHVLYSLLAWASVRLFGLSAFALRLPSVLPGLLLLIATARWLRLLSGSRLLSLVGLAVVALNPLVMDFQVAARGYGLGLALSVWAWSLLGQNLLTRSATASTWRRQLLTAGVAQGLAVGANLVYALPNLALGVAFLPLRLAAASADRRVGPASLAGWYLLPGAFVGLALSFPLLGYLGGDRFYYGAGSLGEMTLSLAQPSVYALCHSKPWGLPPELPSDGPGLGTYALMAGFVGTLIPLPVAVYRLSRDPTAWRDDRTAICAFVAGGTVLLLALLAGCHWMAGVPYPKDRTGLYLIPLAVGCLLVAARGSRVLAAGAAVVLTGLAGLFAGQLQADYLYLWRFDAGADRAYRLLAEQATDRPGLRAGHDWIFEPTLNFYRTIHGPGPLPPFGRGGPDGDYDLYYLEARTAREWVRTGRLKPIYEDPVSGSVVGVPLGPGGS